MPLRVNLSVRGAQEVKRRIAHVSPSIRENGKRVVGEIGQHLATWARQHFEDSGLHPRTGDLRRSEEALPATEDARGIHGGMIASQGLPYGPAQEFGATITPVHATMLAIPMEEARTPAGVARFAPQDAEAEGYTHTFFSPVGNQVMLWGVKDGEIFPLFLLVRSVTLKPHPFVAPVLPANRDYINRRLKEAVDAAIREAH